MEAKRTWKQRIVQEVKNLAVVLIYLWVFLTVFELHEAIVLSEHNIEYNLAEGLVFALVNAWILAKFVVWTDVDPDYLYCVNPFLHC